MTPVRVCGQCETSLGVRRGRCRSCGALVDVTTVARADRVRDLLRFDAWDWAGELVGLTILLLVVVDVLPVWAVALAVVLTVRPFARWAFLIAGRLLDD